MKVLRDKVAVITGAGSGIGRALGVELGKEGMELIIVDINEEGLLETCEMIKGHGSKATHHVVDVSDREAVHQFAKSLNAQGKGVDVLINNAGVLLCDTLENVTHDDFAWIMDVNFWGVVNVTKAFLPYMKDRGPAHIVNMSSLAGIVTTPCNGPYAISKSAVKAFTETLIQELRGTDLRVSCVIAGGVRTNIFRKASKFRSATPGMTSQECAIWYENAAKTTPEQAAKIIIKGIKKNKPRIIIGSDARIVDFLARIIPVGTNVVAGIVMSNLHKFNLPWGKGESSSIDNPDHGAFG